MDPVSLVVSILVSTIAGQIVRAITPKQKRVSEQQRRVLAANQPTEVQQVDSPLAQVSAPGGPQIGIFGRRRVGGRIVMSAKTGTATYTVLNIAGSPCQVNAIYVNNGLIARNGSDFVTTSPWTGLTMKIRLFDGSQVAAETELVAAFPGWTAAMVGRNQTYAYIKIDPGSNTAYESGTPDFTFDVSGFTAYDPRNSAHNIDAPDTWTITTNAAIVAANYLMSDLGRRLPPTSIDWDSVIAAANVCDELVPLASGLSEARYACSAYWTTNEAHETVIARIEQAMAGHVYFLGTKYRVDAGMFDATGAPTITPDDYVGDGIAFADTPPIDQICNGVRGQFASPSNNFETRDFPAYQDAAALAEDGGQEHWLDVGAFDFVTSPSQAQRLARIMYNKARKGAAVNVDVRFAWFDTCRGDVVKINDPLADILDKTYRVEADEVDPGFAIEFELLYEDATFYEWDAATDEQAMPPPVNLNSAGGIGVDPDLTGTLQPPGATFHGTNTDQVTATFIAGPSSRATHWEFQVKDYTGSQISTQLIAVSTVELAPNGLSSSSVGTVRVRSVVLATGEVSAFNTINISATQASFASTVTDPATTTSWVLPPPRAMQINSSGTGSAILDYFAQAFPRTASIEIWRNTSNTTVGATQIGTYSNVNGQIIETQTPGSTFYYFARLTATPPLAPARFGPWSNSLLVAF